MKIFQMRQQTYSELEHKHTSFIRALDVAVIDPEIKKSVETSYTQLSGEKEQMNITLAKVRSIDQDLVKLEN
jgi:hypothetical protein